MSITCTNCGKSGHYYKNCIEPITSFGIILVQVLGKSRDDIRRALINDATINGLEGSNFRYLMVRRKDSLGFIELLRGKYNLSDADYILSLLEQTSLSERERLITQPFDILWDELWNGPASKPYRNEHMPAKTKYEALRDDPPSPSMPKNLRQLISEVKTTWVEPEWGFPKGRRGPGESELKCSLREFWEETRFPLNQIEVVRNLNPLEESFFGSNKIHYRHKYHLAFCFTDYEPNIIPGDATLEREIGEIKWFTLEDAINHIRPYNVEKREMILHASSVLRNFAFGFGEMQVDLPEQQTLHALENVRSPTTNIGATQRGNTGFRSNGNRTTSRSTSANIHAQRH